MGYHMDYKAVTLDEYRIRLETEYLTKSRLILRESKEPFDMMKAMGLESVNDIIERLKTKKKLEQFSLESSIDQGYLAILIREIKSTMPKPIKLSDFKSLPDKLKDILIASGIKDTKELYDSILTFDGQKQLASEFNVDAQMMERLIALTDLCRIRWVNHTFAEMLYDIGYRSVSEVAKTDVELFYSEVNQVNREQSIYKGTISKKDCLLCIQVAGDIPDDIERI